MAAISSGTASVPESGPGWSAPLDRMLKRDLAGLDDRALLVTRHQGLVWPSIIGEIKRHFRDQRWQMHVKRPAHPRAQLLRSRLLELEGTRAHAGLALVPPPPTGRASATSANRLYGGRRAWSFVSFAIS